MPSWSLASLEQLTPSGLHHATRDIPTTALLELVVVLLDLR